MKHVLLFFSVMVSFCACQYNTNEEPVFHVNYVDPLPFLDERVESKTDSLLVAAEEPLDIPFYFSDDAKLESQDPHAFWLMDGMERMQLLVTSADDCWAWMVAMDKRIEEYNRRLGRQIGSSEQAMLALSELIGQYTAGNQREINTASWILSSISFYKVLDENRDIISMAYFLDSYPDSETPLSLIAYQEYTHWYDIYRSLYEIMLSYTVAMARYSSLSMDISAFLDGWCSTRQSYLKMEHELIMEDQPSMYKRKLKPVTRKKFKALLGFFKNLTQEDLYYEIQKDMGIDDYDYANELSEDRFDFVRIQKVAAIMEISLDRWLDVRDQIAKRIPIHKRSMYRSMTSDMYAQFYSDLEELQDLLF